MNWQAAAEIGGFFIVVLGLLWNFAYSRGQDDQIKTHLKTEQEKMTKQMDGAVTRISSEMTRQLSEFNAQMSKLWAYKDNHERESAETRLEIQKQFGKIEATIALRDGQYSEILRSLGSLNGKVENVEKRLDDIYKRGGNLETN